MPLPSFQTRDEIPEPFREEYEERDGAWYPKTHQGAEAGDALKSALEKEREAAREAEKARKKLETDIADLRKKMQQTVHGLSDEQREKVYADVRSELEREYEDRVTELSTKAAGFEKESAARAHLLLERSVKQALIEGGARAKRADALLKLTVDDFQLTADGKLIQKGKPANDISKFVTESVKKSYPEFFEGTGADGGGAGGIVDGILQGHNISVEDALKNPGALIAAGLAARKSA
jgi:hypothetical protein